MDARAALSQLACPLIPVVVIDTLDDAVPVAEALLRGGDFCTGNYLAHAGGLRGDQCHEIGLARCGYRCRHGIFS